MPAELGQLRALRVLDVSFNKLTTLPDEVGALDSLVELAASDNQIASLPASLGTGCRALRVLNLRYKQLNALPPTLAARGSRALQLSGNPLERRATSPDRVADGCRPAAADAASETEELQARIAALEVQEEQLRVEHEQVRSR